MVRNVQTTTTNGLRKNKNRVTQKTRLRIVRGQLDDDAILIDADDENDNVLAIQGVDAEDVNEHHLQVALNAVNRKNDRTDKKQNNDSHIPIPAANGVVDVQGYDAMYPKHRFKLPATHLRFSETVEEAVDGGILGGYTYFLDERDVAWIERNNKEVRGEGTSASATAPNANGHVNTEDYVVSARIARSRSSKAKGKEPESAKSNSNSSTSSTTLTSPTHLRTLVDEDEFELVMGLFEKFTDDKFPFIHLDMRAFPSFSDYETPFAMAGSLSSTLFTGSGLGSTSVLPPSERLVAVARTVYPHWKDRKIEREGKRIVPQLDIRMTGASNTSGSNGTPGQPSENDENEDEASASYICFRRSDVKPVRRMRAASTVYTDKLLKLKGELKMGLELAKMVVKREQIKKEEVRLFGEVWEARRRLVEKWKEGGGVNEVPMRDEALLVDKERVVKKPKMDPLGRIVLGRVRGHSASSQSAPYNSITLSHGRGSQSPSTPQTDTHSPLTAHLEMPGVNLNTLSPSSYVAVQNTVRDRYMDVQNQVEREVAAEVGRCKEGGWEDFGDMPVQPLPEPHPERFFRSLRDKAPELELQGYTSPEAPISAMESLERDRNLNIDADVGLIASNTNSSITPSSGPLSWTSLGVEYPSTSPSSPNSYTLSSRNIISNPKNSHADIFSSNRQPHPLRLRAGRGGRACIDRRIHTPYLSEHPLFRAQPPTSKDTSMSSPLSRYLTRSSIYGVESMAGKKRKRVVVEEHVVGFEQTMAKDAEGAVFSEWEKVELKDRKWDLGGENCMVLDDERMEVDEEDLDVRRRLDLERDCARRLDERWRYDRDGEGDGSFGEERGRIILDDYKARFLRTRITLLSASDHEMIKTEAHHLVPPLIPSSSAKPPPVVLPTPMLSSASTSMLSPMNSTSVGTIPSTPIPTTAAIINARAIRTPSLPVAPAIPKLPTVVISPQTPRTETPVPNDDVMMSASGTPSGGGEEMEVEEQKEVQQQLLQEQAPQEVRQRTHTPAQQQTPVRHQTPVREQTQPAQMQMQGQALPQAQAPPQLQMQTQPQMQAQAHVQMQMQQQQAQSLHAQQRQRLQQQQQRQHQLQQLQQLQQQQQHQHQQQHQQQQAITRQQAPLSVSPLPTMPLSKSSGVTSTSSMMPQVVQRTMMQNQATQPALNLSPSNSVYSRQMSIGPSHHADDGATVRVSLSMRPKMQSTGLSVTQVNPMNGFGNDFMAQGQNQNLGQNLNIMVQNQNLNMAQNQSSNMVPNQNSNMVQNQNGNMMQNQNANMLQSQNGNTVQNQNPVHNMGHTQNHVQGQGQGQQHIVNGHVMSQQQYATLRSVYHHQQQQQQQRAMQAQMNGSSGGAAFNLQMGPANLNLKLPVSRPVQMQFQAAHSQSPVPMHASPPTPNVNMNLPLNGSPVLHARSPSMNGHLMTPSTHHQLQGRASPSNGLFPHVSSPHTASPLVHSSLPGSPHHPANFALPLHTNTPPRTAPGLMHQHIVGAAGQGQQYL